MKKVVLAVFLHVVSLFYAIGQDLTAVTDACPAQPIQFNAPTPPLAGTAQYEWDFCTGDLLLTPQASLTTPVINAENITNGTGIQRPEGIDVVFDGTNWYGFILGWNSKTILRADFGNSLDNAPTYYSLQNPNNLLSSPFHIKVLKVNGIWYAFITNIIEGTITRINFGANLNNNAPTATNLIIPAILYPQSVDVKKDGNNYYLLITSAVTQAPSFVTRFSAFNLGTDITNNSPTATHTNFNYAGEFWTDFAVIKEGANWYGLIGGATTGGQMIGLLNFGNSITNTPTYTSLNNAITSTVGQVRGIGLQKEGNNYIAICATEFGDILRVNFGSSMTNTPVMNNLGNFGLLGRKKQDNRPSLCFVLTRRNSEYVGFAINRRLELNGENQLIKLQFPNLCNAIPSTSIANNPTSTFYQASIEEINLIVKDEDGNSIYTYSDELLVKNAIISEFSYTEQCLGSVVLFSNLSRGSEANLQSWEWSFGDGQTSNQKAPTHTYAQAGLYQVKLKVNNISGCQNESVKNIRISSRPKSDFIIKNIDCANKTVTIQDISDLPATDKSQGGEIRNRVWLFGDGSRWIASPYTATTYTKTYTTQGDFTITLTVTDDAGCSSTTSKQISLSGMNTPNANFSFSNACKGVPVNFVDNSTLPASSMGDITDWQWSFFNLDGATIMANSTLAQPNFTYTTTGNYLVKLRVRNSLGCSSEISKTVNVKESLNSDFSTSVLTGKAPLTVNFTNLTTGASSYFWNFGNGVISTAQSPTQIYTQDGVYVVSFQANNSNGCGSIATRTIIVEQPTANEPQEPAYKVNVYPNPTHQDLFVEFPFLPTRSTFGNLMNMAGKVVLTTPMELSKNKIDISNLPAGMYILDIREGKNTFKIKVIKI